MVSLLKSHPLPIILHILTHYIPEVELHLSHSFTKKLSLTPFPIKCRLFILLFKALNNLAHFHFFTGSSLLLFVYYVFRFRHYAYNSSNTLDISCDKYYGVIIHHRIDIVSTYYRCKQIHGKVIMKYRFSDNVVC